MSFIADLHIHSRFSMATSRALTVASLAGWAMRKGINVLGTGDFTHPGWRNELGQTLVQDDHTGLLRLKTPPDLPSPVPDCSEPWFCLQTEISCIYKRGGKIRKIHNLIFMPDFESADKFSARLALRCNLASDGRPVIGLDSRDLFELALDCSPNAVLIPAHIWTPWFGLLGSKSGFDAIEECYGDLTSYIFALETGLSSDPPMNRLWSRLDSFAMISNSDAHSGVNLGREANLFSGSPSYSGIFNALAKAARREDVREGESHFLGTLEFYPEEGKYHLDGHRACNIVLSPDEARALNNRCPVCKKSLTIGVLHRVTDLADRLVAPELIREPQTRMLIPLPEVTGQIMRLKPASRNVERKCAELVSEFGAELDILCLRPIEEIRAFWEPLGEAVQRVRSRHLHVSPGYDGVYGRIEIFTKGDLPG